MSGVRLDRELMELALGQARLALEAGAMPIGAVLARKSSVLAEAHWQGTSGGLLRHPEHELLVRADPSIPPGARPECTLYTTLEPCLMCMGTAMSFFLGRIVYALPAPADGAADVATRWTPTLGHPVGGGAYSIPAVEGGLGSDRAKALIVAWLETGVTGPMAQFARRTLGE